MKVQRFPQIKTGARCGEISAYMAANQNVPISLHVDENEEIDIPLLRRDFLRFRLVPDVGRYLHIWLKTRICRYFSTTRGVLDMGRALHIICPAISFYLGTALM